MSPLTLSKLPFTDCDDITFRTDW